MTTMTHLNRVRLRQWLAYFLMGGGLFSIWGENYDEGFDKRLCAAGFTVSNERPGRGGFRHVVFLAKLPLSRTKQLLTHMKK